VIDRPYAYGKFPGEILRISSYLEEEAEYYTRHVYNLLDLLGNLGGVSNVILLVIGIVLYPISEQSFELKATSELFKARTSNNEIFADPSTKISNVNREDQELQSSISNHKTIKVAIADKLKLYLSNRWFCKCLFNWKNRGNITKLHAEGTKRINKMLDLKKIV
jgi:hypothetical protein